MTIGSMTQGSVWRQGGSCKFPWQHPPWSLFVFLVFYFYFFFFILFLIFLLIFFPCIISGISRCHPSSSLFSRAVTTGLEWGWWVGRRPRRRCQSIWFWRPRNALTNFSFCYPHSLSSTIAVSGGVYAHHMKILLWLFQGINEVWEGGGKSEETGTKEDVKVQTSSWSWHLASISSFHIKWSIIIFLSSSNSSWLCRARMRAKIL